MGIDTSSIFYPDNANRRHRAQELADDCQYAQSRYEAAKKAVEAELGPLKEKVDKLLNALHCKNIHEFDQLVLKNATGDALAHWENVRSGYDKSLVFDQVLMVVEGIVTVGGLIVSAAGALLGGFGFLAGIAVTTDILLILGILGAIYDIINGAIQRAKLQDAISSLVPTRIKAKYAQTQMEQLLTSVPTIQTLYQMFEEMGYNEGKIMQKFKDRDYLKSLRTASTKITYTSVAQELANMDSRRKSWTNEDPNWSSIAWSLDNSSGFRGVPFKLSTISAPPVSVNQPLYFSSTVGLDTLSSYPLDMRNGHPEIASLAASEKIMDTTPPAHNGKIMVQFQGNIAPILSSIFHLVLQDFDEKDSARVRVNSEYDRLALVADIDNKTVKMDPAPVDAAAVWSMRFVDPLDSSLFATHGPDFDLSRRPHSAAIYVYMGDLYLKNDGSLTTEWDQPSAVLTASYA